MQHLTRLTSSSLLKLFPFSASFISPALAPLSFLRGLPLALPPALWCSLSRGSIDALLTLHSGSALVSSASPRVAHEVLWLPTSQPNSSSYIQKPLRRLPPPVWNSHYSDQSLPLFLITDLEFSAVSHTVFIIWFGGCLLVIQEQLFCYTFSITLMKGYFLSMSQAFW